MDKLTHISKDGSVQMVDVTEKDVTEIFRQEEVFTAENRLQKTD